MTEVICDNKKLVYSNRICCISNESISLKIDLTNMNTHFLNVIFNFHYDGEDAKASLHSPENGKVVFDLNNYSSSLGTGIRNPVEVGALNNKKLYIIFCVYRLDKNAFPILDVSLYMEV